MKITLIISLFAHFTVFAAIAVHEPVRPAQSGGFTEVSIIAKAPAVNTNVEKSVEQERPQPPPLPTPILKQHTPEPTTQKDILPVPVIPTEEHITPTPVENVPAEEHILSVPVESTSTEISAINEEKSYSQEQIVHETPQMPQELYFPEPAYPVIAKKRRLEGSVLLAIYIDQSGKVTNIEVLSSSGHKILDNAALSIKDKLKYTPATENGVAVDFMLTKTVTFRLEGK
jgi:protein TonB